MGQIKDGQHQLNVSFDINTNGFYREDCELDVLDFVDLRHKY
jgi:hypothetical protein